MAGYIEKKDGSPFRIINSKDSICLWQNRVVYEAQEVKKAEIVVIGEKDGFSYGPLNEGRKIINVSQISWIEGYVPVLGEEVSIYPEPRQLFG